MILNRTLPGKKRLKVKSHIKRTETVCVREVPTCGPAAEASGVLSQVDTQAHHGSCGFSVIKQMNLMCSQTVWNDEWLEINRTFPWASAFCCWLSGGTGFCCFLFFMELQLLVTLRDVKSVCVQLCVWTVGWFPLTVIHSAAQTDQQVCLSYAVTK